MRKLSAWLLTGTLVLGSAGFLFASPALADEVATPDPVPAAAVNPWRTFTAEARTAMQSKAAELLSMTVEELQAALAAGQTVAEVATKKGVALADLQAVMTAELKAQLESAVAAGSITQAQADLMLERHEQNSAARLDGDLTGRMGMGMGQGMNQGRGMGRGQGMGQRQGVGPGAGMGQGRGMGQGAGMGPGSCVYTGL